MSADFAALAPPSILTDGLGREVLWKASSLPHVPSAMFWGFNGAGTESADVWAG